MIDICFVGNSSIDYIENSKGKKKVFGGSCIYSAFSCRNSTKANILVISNANNELYELLKSRNIEFKGNVLSNINSFEINEMDNTCKFINRVDTSINLDEAINIGHLHVSFRKGVDIDNVLNNPNINYNSLSVDVMIYSVEEFIPYLKKYSKKITTLFCNSKEYIIIIELKDKLVYMKDICDQYIKSFPNINHYSVKAKQGNGHDIIRPVLWNMILERAVMFSKEQSNIIQFSRGKDIAYENEFGNNVYETSLQSIINKLSNQEDTIIINLSSDLQIRKSRNYLRYKNGGHFVSEETMNEVYNDDIFNYEHTDENRGFILLNGISYPVYTIFNNKNLSQVELNQFMMYNLNEIINYFNEFRKGDNNEYERNSKKYLAKQNK